MTTTKPGALAALLNDIHTAVRHYSAVPEGTPLANVVHAFEDRIGADWQRPLSEVLPEIDHTPRCVQMGWWLLHPADSSCDPEVATPDAGNPELPVLGDELRLTDGTTARVLQQYDGIDARTIAGKDLAWQVTGPTGARVVTLDNIVGYVDAEATDTDHGAALVLNAAIDWENAKQRLHTEGSLIASADVVNAQIILQHAIRAYMPAATS